MVGELVHIHAAHRCVPAGTRPRERGRRDVQPAASAFSSDTTSVPVPASVPPSATPLMARLRRAGELLRGGAVAVSRPRCRKGRRAGGQDDVECFRGARWLLFDSTLLRRTFSG
jgi:hypothetical protein